MKEDICTYFVEHPNNPGVGSFGEHIICDNYSCSSNEGKFFSAEIGCDIGFCKTNAAKNPELEEMLNERNMNGMNMNGMSKAHQGIKPIDSKTNNSYED